MAKANVGNQIQLDNLIVCPVCFQKFNIPRILPCSHTFCHGCLNGHIKSSCDKTSPLGFTCPLCRDFIPAPGIVGQHASDKWCELIPTNRFIASLLEKCNDLADSTVLCDVCKTDENEETATSWCKDCEGSFCQKCSEMHKKFNPIQKHEVVPLDVAKNAGDLTEYTPEFCTTHPKGKVDHFCRDHQMSSCGLCVPLLHQTCKHIGPIEEEAAKSEKTKLKANGLLKELKRVCEDLEKVIEIEKINIGEIDENVDLFSGMIKESYERCVGHLNEVKERQLNQLSKMSKDSKFKLESSIQKYENRKDYLRKCQKTLKGALESENHVETLLWYSLIKENVGEIQKMEFEKLRIDLTSCSCGKNICEIENFEGFVDLNLQQNVTGIPEVIDCHKKQLHDIRKWKFPDSYIRGGAFLSNGFLILTDFNLCRCVLFSEEGVLQRESQFSGSLWGMYYDQTMEVLYLTIPEKKEIKMIDFNHFYEIKTFHTKSPARGITKVNDRFFTIGPKWLCTLNPDFELVTETDVDDDSDDITSDVFGSVIYSCYQKSTVTKKNDKNEIIFVYKHRDLKSPYGLAVDRIGNIYVCGYHSNNIHVISGSGKTLRILHGFKSPKFISFQDNSFKFFVVDDDGVRICEFK